MKKYFLALAIAVLCAFAFALAGCSGASNTGESAEDSDPEESIELEAAREDLDITIADDEYCTIKATEIFQTSAVAGYYLTVVNKTDARLLVRSIPDSFTVNGQAISSSFTVEVNANSEDFSVVPFLTNDLGGGIDKLKDVNFRLEAVSSRNVETVGTYDASL